MDRRRYYHYWKQPLVALVQISSKKRDGDESKVSQRSWRQRGKKQQSGAGVERQQWLMGGCGAGIGLGRRYNRYPFC
ncbi:hypothetical protein ACHQM5_020022 [Ranunculus cassubicifolius]